MDLHGFYTGQEFAAQDFLGAHPLPQGGVVFRTFAPAAQNVNVIGEFSGWENRPMAKILDGNFWELTLPEAEVGQKYKYRIYTAGGPVDHCDPYGFGMELRPASASIVRRLSDYSFTDDRWMAARTNCKAAPLNIYEVHFGSWRQKPDGGWYTYAELAPLLVEYAQKMGYNYLELMPLAEHPCDESWGYQTTGFFAPSSRWGTAAELMEFVDLCHKGGIGVLLDFVPVHFAVDSYALAQYDGTALYEYPHAAVGLSEWGSCNFMHSRGEVRSFLQSCAAYWLGTYHFDGLRMDAISRIIFWQGDEARGVNNMAVDFLRTMNSGLKIRYPSCILAAEDSTHYHGVTQPVSAGGLGFDYKWDMGWMNDTLVYFQTGAEYRTRDYHKLTFSMMYFRDDTFLLPLSHDENVHGKATVLQKMSGDYAQKFPQGRCLYLYQMTHPGKKLNFMGGELGQLREWDEKREQDWMLLDYPVHDSFHAFSAVLNQLYLTHPALWAEDYAESGFNWVDCQDTAQCVYAYRRSGAGQDLYVVLHLGDGPVDYKLALPEGGYRVLLHTEWQEWGGTLPHSQKTDCLRVTDAGLPLTLPAFSGLILMPEPEKAAKSAASTKTVRRKKAVQG